MRAFLWLPLLLVPAHPPLAAQGAASPGTAGELTRTRLAAAEALLQLNRVSTARRYLDAVAPADRELAWRFLDAALDRSAGTVRVAGTAPTASALSPDGRLLAVAGSDHVIHLHAFPSLEVVRALTGHTASVSTVAFNRDGTRLVSGGRDHAVILWDVHAGSRLATNSASFSQGIYQVRFNRDDTRIGVATWALDRTRTPAVVGFAALLDARDLRETRRFETDPHPASGVVFLSDDRTMVVSSWGEMVHAFDLETGTARWRFDLSDPESYNAFHTIALSPDGATVAVGATDYRIYLLDTSNGAVRRRIEPWEGHARTLKALAFSRDGQWLASAGEDQTILIWSTRDHTRRQSLVGHVGTVNGLSWSPDGSTLVSSASDSTLKRWDIARPFLRTATICDYGPWQTPVSRDGRFFVAPCSDTSLALHGLESGAPPARLGARSGLAADISADGQWVVTASFDGIVRLWDVEARRESRTFTGHRARVDGVAVLDRQGLVASVGDTTLRVWELASGRSVAVVPFESAPFRLVAHPAGDRVFVSAADGTIRVLATDTWRELARYSGTESAQEMTLSRDGRLLAVFAGRTIQLWDTGTGTLRHTLRGHEAAGYGVGFSPDGRHLVSGAGDLTVRLWDVESGTCLLTYHGFDERPYTTRFLTDGQLLVTSSQGRLWQFRLR